MLAAEFHNLPTAVAFLPAALNNMLNKTRRIRMRSYACEGFAVLCAVIALLVLVRPWHEGDRSWCDFQDNTNFIAPLMASISMKWHESGAPLLISDIVGGYPVYANPHFNVHYPLYFLWTHNFENQDSTVHFINRLILLHLVLFTINIYILSRVLKSTRAISAAIAATLPLGTVAISSVHWVTITAATSWMPAVFAGVVLVLRGRRRAGFILLVASASLLIYAMPAQVLAITIAASLSIILVWAARAARTSPAFLPACITFAAALLAIASLCGPYLYSVLSFHSASIRWIGSAGPPIVGSNARLPKSALAEFSYGMSDLSEFLFQRKTAIPIGGISFGGLPIALACYAIAVAFIRRRVYLIAFGVGGAPFTLLAFHWFAVHVNYYLPLIDKVREVSWFGIVGYLATSLLAGSALSALSSAKPITRTERLLLTLASLGASLASLIFLDHESSHAPASIAACLLGAQTLLLVLVWLPRADLLTQPTAFARRRLPRLIAIAITILVFYPLNLPVPPLLSGNEINSTEAQTANHELKTLTYIAPSLSDYRVSLPEGKAINWSMDGLYYGIRSYQGFITPQIYRSFSLLYFIGTRPNASQLAGIRYRIRPTTPATADSKIWRILHEDTDWTIEENPAASPRVFFARRIAGQFDPSNPESYWTAVERTPRRAGDIFTPTGPTEPLFAPSPSGPGLSDNGTIDLIADDDQNVKVRAYTPGPAILVLNEYLSPEWQAAIEDRPARLIPVNLTQMALKVPAGYSQVTFSYSPTILGLTLGTWSILGWIAAAYISYRVLSASPARRGRIRESKPAFQYLQTGV